MKTPQVALLAFCLAAPVTLPAELFVYEGFDYPIGQNGLALQNGGIGFNTAWDDQTNDGEILAPALSYTDSGGRMLLTSGNMARMDGSTAGTSQNFRTINSSLYSGENVLYFSLLGQKIPSGMGTQLDSRAVNFAIFSPAGERVSIGHGTDSPAGGFAGEYRWGFFTNGNGGNGQVGDTTNSHYSQFNIQSSAFIVLKLELNANGVNERMSLFVNPSLDAEPAVPSAIVIDTRDIATVMSDLNRFRPFGGGQNTANGAGIFNLDEVRVGSTYADVTPFIPEPGSATLAACAALGLLGRRRR